MATKTVRLTIRVGILIGLAFVLLCVSLTPTEAGQKVEATLASVNAPAYLASRAWTLLAQKVREKTNDGLIIKPVFGGALGGMKENFEAIRAGNLEMAIASNTYLGSLYAGTMLFDLPFIFRDVEHMKHVVRGPIGQQVYGELEMKTGIKILMTGLPDGPRSAWNIRRPIRTPEDMKGLKIRVQENPIQIDSFKVLGAIPTPMAYPEIYMAAKQGVIDGAEGPPNSIKDQKAHEIGKYYSLTKQFVQPLGLGVSAKWFNALPPEYQRVMLEEGNNVRAWYDNEYARETEDALKELQQLGMQINDVADMEQFRKASAPVYDKYADRIGGWKMIQAVIDTK